MSGTEMNETYRRRGLDSEQGLLLAVLIMVLLGMAGIFVVS